MKLMRGRLWHAAVQLGSNLNAECPKWPTWLWKPLRIDPANYCEDSPFKRRTHKLTCIQCWYEYLCGRGKC